MVEQRRAHSSLLLRPLSFLPHDSAVDADIVAPSNIRRYRQIFNLCRRKATDDVAPRKRDRRDTWTFKSFPSSDSFSFCLCSLGHTLETVVFEVGQWRKRQGLRVQGQTRVKFSLASHERRSKGRCRGITGEKGSVAETRDGTGTPL